MNRLLLKKNYVMKIFNFLFFSVQRFRLEYGAQVISK